MRQAMTRSGLVMVALLAFAAMTQAQTVVKVNVPFAFKAGNDSFAAGAYTIRTNDTDMTVEVTPANGRGFPLLAETRLGGSGVPTAEGRLVFDKVGDQHYLSEVWAPNEDGYLLHVTRGKHSHVHVKFEKRAS